MRIIKSIHCQKAVVEDCDYAFLSQLRWSTNHDGYFVCTIRGLWKNVQIEGKRLHWFIMELNGFKKQRKHTVDHIDRNPLNNLHSNLRFANQQQQCFNRTQANTKKGLYGAYPTGKNWRSVIHIKSKMYYLGVYGTPEEASRVAKEARKKLEVYNPPFSELEKTKCLDLTIIRRVPSSKYPCICWNKKAKKWQCQLRRDGKLKYLGLFKTEKEALKAYLKEKNSYA